ncbi:MAG TPA: hypothetical protein PK079_23700 [Leptospiraceae bacterium]|nr:hypothetical protein [Leptospiraceae bacterium]HNA10463.1 hypothetical protein [Leptospiraceae bacterium]HNC00878.1 hypothetical protein [Leptospiraceae bacterium]HNE11375.1 hypothetical protein [Leptospiraceae bacterium]HNE56188.1 hypothetical protein [Leptospiraceae bacterium]
MKNGKILIIVFLFLNCYVSEPRAKCEEVLRAFNFQAVYSFGKACLYPTYDNDPENRNRCAVVALWNELCKKEPEKVYKMDLDIDLDGSEKKSREKEEGRTFNTLFFLYAQNLIESNFVYEKGENLTDLLKYLVNQNYSQNVPDGETRSLTCSKGGIARTTFTQKDFVVNFQDCQHTRSYAANSSTLTWNGNLQGSITYNRVSNTYFLDTASLQGNNVSYRGSISISGLGIRGIDEICRVSLSYSNYRGFYNFCNRSSQ